MAAAIELTTNEIKNLLEKYFEIENLKQKSKQLEIINYEFKPVSDAPTGFLGQHSFLKVKVATKLKNGEELIEKLHFFVKSAPLDNKVRMQYLMEFGAFQKEILTYRDVLPELRSCMSINITPKCYYANENLIILENLNALGYKMVAGRDGVLDYEHLNCALKSLAALHASSIIFEQRSGKKLNELFPKALTEGTYVSGMPRNHVRVKNFFKVMEVLKAMITEMPKYEYILNFILEELPKRATIVYELAQTSTKYINVFNHADVWANNLLYKKNDKDGLLLDCRLVDFQLVRYAPPMMDLMSLLTITTSREFRQLHAKNLINDYYRFLIGYLSDSGLSIDNFLPRNVFDAGIEEFRIFAVVESCLFNHLTVLPDHLTADLVATVDGFQQFFTEKRVEICMQGFNTDNLYRERMCDIIEDLIDNFILKH